MALKILKRCFYLLLFSIFLLSSKPVLASDINLGFAKSFRGTTNDIGFGIAVDANGNVYTTGYFTGTVDFDPGDGAFNLASAGGNDIFVSKLDASGDFVWAKKMGGTGNDQGISIAVDDSGNSYTTGLFTGTVDFDPGVGTFYLTSAGNLDVFISKLDSSGNFLWAKRVGGASAVLPTSLLVDSSGNIFVTGYFAGTADFDPGAGTFNLTSAGSNDIFLAKLNSDGDFIWAKKMGGSGDDQGTSLAINSNGDIYLAGMFYDTVDFDPGAGTFNLTSSGSNDIFISKLDSGGNLIWAKKIGGSSTDKPTSLAVDASGNLFVTGYFAGTADFDPGAGTFNLTSSGDFDGSIVKLDANGNLVWAKKISGPGREVSNYLSFDAIGNIYVTGYFSGTADFDPSAATYTLTSAGLNDIFIVKLDVSGDFIWAEKIGGAGYDNAYLLRFDANNNFYLVGYFSSTVDFDPGAGSFNLTSAGGYEIFVLKYQTVAASVTSSVANIESISATLNGNILEGDNITVRGFNYGLSTTNTATTTESGAFSAGEYSYNLSGLSCGTTYHYRAYYIDSLGTNYSNWSSFTSGACLSLSSSVSGINGSLATLNGTILGGDNVTVRGFNYGLSTADTATTTENGTFTAGQYSYNISGLSCGTTYYYRAYATDNLGTSYSSWSSFTSGACLSLSSSVSGINGSLATLNGTILGGDNITVRGFNYGLSTDNAATTTENGTFTAGQYSYNLSSLSCETYYYRAYATDNLGTSYSDWASFTSGACLSLSSSVSSIEASSATLNGNILGGDNVTVRGFNYGLSTDDAVTITENGAFSLGAYSYNLSGLSCGTTYYYRAYATDNLGTNYSNWSSFTSGECLAPTDNGFSFAKRMGGSSNTWSYSTTVDANGNIYTIGSFSSTADFDPGDETFTLTSAGATDIFISKLDANGNFVWAKKIGGSSYDSGKSIAIDSNGNVYITGKFNGTVDFDPGAGTFNLTSAGSFSTGDDIFISKLDTNGNFVWAKKIGVAGNDEGLSVAVDASGGVYTTGYFVGTADFDPGAGTFNLTSAGGNDIFISKLDTNGNFVWAKRMGGTGDDQGTFITASADGDIYLTGKFVYTVDFNPGTETFNLTSAGGSDIFISKLDSSGNFFWAKQIGGTGNNEGTSIKLDDTGNIYTAGYFSGTADFDPGAGTFNLTSVGGNDFFISKLDSSGNFVWAKRMGGSGDDKALALTNSPDRNIYTAGYFSGTADFNPGAETFNLTSAGGSDIFISKLNYDGEFVWAKRIGGGENDQGTSIAASADSNIYLTGIFVYTVDFNPGAETFNLTSAGGYNVFVLKLRRAAALTISSSVTNIARSSATLNGSILGGDNVTVRGFNYGLSVNNTATTTESGVFSDGNYSHSLSNLSCGTTYYYRAYAVQDLGVYYSNWNIFTTETCLSLSSSVSDVGGDSATLNGNILIGSNINVRGFNYGLSTDNTATTTESGTFNEGEYSYNLSNLSCGTTYYYRTYVTDSLETDYGDWNSFTTTACLSVNSSVNNISEGLATLNGNILGGDNVTVRGFNYGLSADNAATTTENGTFSEGGFSYNLSNLAYGATYYYRAYAADNLGTTYSDWKSFLNLYSAEVKSLILPATSTSLTIPVTIIATDNTSAYMLTETSTPPASNDPAWQATAPTSYTFSAPKKADDDQWSSVKVGDNLFYGDITASFNGKKATAVFSRNLDVNYPGGVFTSDDYGQSWVNKNQTSDWYRVTSSLDGEKLFSSLYSPYGSARLAVSLDGADYWTIASTTPNSYGKIFRSLSSSYSGSRVLVTYEDYIYLSNDDGLTWSKKIAARHLSHSSGDYIAAARYGGSIYTSSDGGENWTERDGSGARNWSSIAYAANKSHLAAGVSGGYIYTSSDGGATWIERANAGTASWHKIIISADGQKIAAIPWISYDGTGYIKTSSDGGETWQTRTGAGARPWSSIAASFDFSKIFALSSGPSESFVYSLDFGNTLYAWVKDDGGQVSQISPLSLNAVEIIDSEQPVISDISASNASSAFKISLDTFEASDNVDISGYLLTEASSTPTLDDDNWERIGPFEYSFSSIGSIAFTFATSTVGQKTLYAYVRDSAGNISEPAIINVNLNPFVTSFETVLESDSLTVGINGITASDPEGEVLQYLITETEEAPTANNANWSTVVPTNFTVSEPKSIQPLNWTSATGNLNSAQIMGIANSDDGDKMFFITRSNVFSSSDFGATWGSFNIGSYPWSDITSSADGQNLAICGNTYIKTSNNGGLSWTNRISGNFKAIDSSADGLNIVVAGYNTPVRISNDGGVSWSSKISIDSVDVSMSADGDKIAVARYNSGGIVWVSLDGGENWLEKRLPVQEWLSLGSIQYSQDGSKLLVKTSPGNLYLSENDGDSWTKIFDGVAVYSMAISDNGRFIVASSLPKKIYQSVDGGATFYLAQTFDDFSIQFLSSSGDGSKIIAAAGVGADAGNANWVNKSTTIYTSTIGNPLYAWVKDSFGNISNTLSTGISLINLQPIILSASTTGTIPFSTEMKYAPATISVNDSSRKVSLDLSSVSQPSGSTKAATFSENLTANISSEIRLEILAGTIMEAESSSWSSTFSLPQSRTRGSIALNASDVVSIFEIGDPNSTLTLNKAVRITFFGQADKNIGFINNRLEFRAISDVCTGDSQADGDALSAYGDCKIAIGDDLVVWSKHFSEYVIYTGDNPVLPPADPNSSSLILSQKCSSVVYDVWQDSCINGKQYRNILSQSPNFCSLTSEQRSVTERACGEQNKGESEVITETNTTTSGGIINELVKLVIAQEKKLSGKVNNALVKKLAGQILLQVENRGQAWYLDPVLKERYFLADGNTAFNALRKFGLGITNQDLAKIPVAKKSVLPEGQSISTNNYSKSLINRLKGRIVLQVQNHGEAWYINPSDGFRYYLASGEAAFEIMRSLSLGITDKNLRQVPVGEY